MGMTAEKAEAAVKRISTMGPSEMAGHVRSALEKNPTGFHVWPEVAERIAVLMDELVKLRREAKGEAPEQFGVRKPDGRRVSAMPDDVGYRPDAYLFSIFLDGREVEACHTADERDGTVYVYQYRPGSPRPTTARLTGDVEIRGPK